MGRLSTLQESLTHAYSLDELRALCADLDVPFESLRGETLPAKALALLQFLDRRGQLPGLIARAASQRPEFNWPLPAPRKPDEPDDDDEPAGGVALKTGDIGAGATVTIGGVADIKNNSGNVVVGGRNVVQIGTLNVPRWMVIAVPALVLVVLIVAGLGTARILSLTKPAATPGPARMSGSFNIVVANFPESNIDGVQTRSDDGDRISKFVFDRLKTEMNSVASAQVWHDSVSAAEKGVSIGIITGASAEDRQASAKALAESIGAHLVIYGDLKKSGSAAEWVPEFYVSTAAVALTKEAEAEDILGRHQLGGAVAVPIPFKSEAGLVVDEQIRLRAVFVRGLLYDLIGLHEKALEDFKGIRPRWASQNSADAAALNFFLGREALFIFRNKPALVTDTLGSASQAIDFATDAFNRSLSGNPNYALGNWGLGTVLLWQAEPVISEGVITATAFAQALTQLDDAVNRYGIALSNTPADVNPLLAAKMRTSLANALRLRGLAKLYQDDNDSADRLFGDALSELDRATALITGNQPRERAIAHWVRGTVLINRGALLYVRGDDPGSRVHYERAKNEFEACLAQYDDPGQKTDIDVTLKTYKSGYCQPSLELVTQALSGG